MFKFHYQHHYKSGNTSQALYENFTILRALFTFGKEIPSNLREDVRNRCSTTTKRAGSHSLHEQDLGPLNQYLFENEGARFGATDLLFGREYYRRRSSFIITPTWFGLGLGFRLREEARGQLPIEEIIDLDALNHFVLTGQSDYQAKQIQKREAQKQQA